MAPLHANGQQSSRDVEQEINRIRHEMDHTLDAIGNYLHPKHLLDYVVDSVRSGPPGASKKKARDVAQQGLDALRAHPGPAALVGGALLWYLMERSSQEQAARDYGSTSSGGRGVRRAATYGAWEEAYDWSSSDMDQATWSEKAQGALDQVRTIIADKTVAAKDKIKRVAGHMVGVSGKTREQLHVQWADLREHAGSFVDARTGEPYDDDYGDEAWSHAAACARLADESADDSSWSSKAQDAVDAMAATLNNAGGSVAEQLRSLGGRLSALVASGRDAVGTAASRAATGARTSVASGYERASSGLAAMGGSARRGADRVTGAVHDGLGRGRQAFSQTLRDEPLAMGAACLGLGLLAGLLAPSTRTENQLLGEAADRVKEQARDAGQHVIQQGKEAATAVASKAVDEAERQGVTPQRAAEKAKQAMARG